MDIPFSSDSAIILSHRLIQLNSCPISWSEVSVSKESKSSFEHSLAWVHDNFVSDSHWARLVERVCGSRCSDSGDSLSRWIKGDRSSWRLNSRRSRGHWSWGWSRPECGDVGFLSIGSHGSKNARSSRSRSSVRDWRRRSIGIRNERISRESPEPCKDTLVRSTVEVSSSRDTAIILSSRVIQGYSSPFSRSKVSLSNEGNMSRSDSIDPDSVSDDETVRIQSENVVSCYDWSKGLIGHLFFTVGFRRVWRMK